MELLLELEPGSLESLSLVVSVPEESDMEGLFEPFNAAFGATGVIADDRYDFVAGSLVGSGGTYTLLVEISADFKRFRSCELGDVAAFEGASLS